MLLRHCPTHPPWRGAGNKVLFADLGTGQYGSWGLRLLGSAEATRHGRKLQRPSGVASCASPSGRISLFVAEVGRISAWEVDLSAQPVAWTHTCDLCAEAFGSGLHNPLRGQWSWLSISCTSAGDIWVADMDNGCVYMV